MKSRWYSHRRNFYAAGWRWQKPQGVPHAWAVVLWRIMTLSHDSNTCRAGHPYDESSSFLIVAFTGLWERSFSHLPYEPSTETISSPVHHISFTVNSLLRTSLRSCYVLELNEDNHKILFSIPKLELNR